MVEFETIEAKEMKFGNNNFIEVAHKKAITETGEREFLAVSRGFFGQDGTKRFTKSFTVPNEVVDFVVDNLKALAPNVKADEPAEEPPAEE